MGNGEQVEHRVGGASHGDVERHGIEERRAGSNVPRKDALVALVIILISILHNQRGSILEQLTPVGMGSKDGSVAGERQPDGLVQAVH